MKKIVFLGLILFSLFFLPACKNQEIQIKSDYIALSCLAGEDKVVMEVEFGFDKTRLASYPQKEVAVFKSRLKENVEKLRNEFLISLALKYTQNPVQEYAINRGVLLSQVALKDDNAGFKITYNSLSAWKYYNSSSSGEKGEDGASKQENSKPFLIKKVSSSGTFVFGEKLSTGKNLGEKYKSAYLSALKDLTLENIEKTAYKPCFVYDYATTSHHLKSDASKQVFVDGLYHHIWVKEEPMLDNARINLWQYAVNYGLWQLLAILVTIIPCAVIVYRQLKKERRLKIAYNKKNKGRIL